MTGFFVFFAHTTFVSLLICVFAAVNVRTDCYLCKYFATMFIKRIELNRSLVLMLLLLCIVRRSDSDVLSPRPKGPPITDEEFEKFCHLVEKYGCDDREFIHADRLVKQCYASKKQCEADRSDADNVIVVPIEETKEGKKIFSELLVAKIIVFTVVGLMITLFFTVMAILFHCYYTHYL